MAFTATFAEVERAPFGGVGYAVTVDATMDTSNANPATGVVLTGCGVQTILGVDCIGWTTAAVGYVPQFDSTLGTLKILIQTGTAAKLGLYGSTFASAVTFRLVVYGY